MKCPEDQLIVTERSALLTWAEASFTNATQTKSTHQSGGKTLIKIHNDRNLENAYIYEWKESGVENLIHFIVSFVIAERLPWGFYEVSSAAFDASGNAAVCSFVLYNRSMFHSCLSMWS